VHYAEVMAAKSFIEDEVATQRARNERLVEAIVRHGGELEEERPIDFFFYAENRSDADALANDLEEIGFDSTHVPDDPVDGKWSVQAVRMATVLEVTDEVFVERIVRLAAKYLAEFDGWGAPI
jgi:regulator of RNase E activity RraB